MDSTEDMKISQEQAKAVVVLVQAVQIAQKRGAYDLNEASQISDAVNLFVKKEESEQNSVPNVGGNTVTNNGTPTTTL